LKPFRVMLFRYKAHHLFPDPKPTQADPESPSNKACLELTGILLAICTT